MFEQSTIIILYTKLSNVTTALANLSWSHIQTGLSCQRLFEAFLGTRKKVYRKVQGVPQSQNVANPRHQEEETKTNKQTNAREAHRPASSSPSEVITVLKRMKKHEDKEHGKTLKHEAPVI